MAENAWEPRFREIYDRAVRIYDEEGGRTANECISSEDQAFLATIGCSPQELYDFAEDWCVAREPAFEEVLAVAAIRRDYFLKDQGGRSTGRVRSPQEFPSGNSALEGYTWLPRILAKARAKLRGELPSQLMFGCGGDRPFLRSIAFGLSEFFALVRAAGDNDAIVLKEIEKRASLLAARGPA